MKQFFTEEHLIIAQALRRVGIRPKEIATFLEADERTVRDHLDGLRGKRPLPRFVEPQVKMALMAVMSDAFAKAQMASRAAFATALREAAAKIEGGT